MSGIIRRLTFNHPPKGPPPVLKPDDLKPVHSLQKTLEAYMTAKTPEKLNEIGVKVTAVWNLIFEKAAAPKKKYELTEEILLRPDIIKLLLVAFRLVQMDVKRKIRDIFLLVICFCSNESPESCVPRCRSKNKFNAKMADQLFYCRESIIDIIAEGYDEPASCGYYNDIVREFVTDETCLRILLEDDGCDSVGFAVRPHGCLWSVFERLTLMDHKTYFDPFDITKAAFDTLRIILLTNHTVVSNFITQNFTKFCLSMQKLISSANFFVQSESLRLLFELLTTRDHAHFRDLWLREPQSMKTVILAMQSRNKTVRAESLNIFEMFLENPNNSQPVREFITRNRNQLITYCWDSAPVHYYQGNRIEQQDARFSRMAYKLLIWDLVRPLKEQEMAEFEEGERLQMKYFEEQTVQTGFQDIMEGVPTVSHEYKMSLPRFPAPIGKPMMFGNPMGIPIQND